MVVFGPINIRGYGEGTTCDVCGCDIRPQKDMYVLRVNGRHLRTCSTACAEAAVEEAKAAETPDAEPTKQLA